MADDRPEIRQWLADRNYSAEDIDKILRKLDEFDLRISRDSLFDEVASGRFDLAPIIQAAIDQ